LLPRPSFEAGAIDPLLLWSCCEELVAAFFFFPRMLSPNPFFVAGSDPTVTFDRENTFDDSVFGFTGSAAGLDNGVGGVVTFISGTMVLLPGVDLQPTWLRKMMEHGKAYPATDALRLPLLRPTLWLEAWEIPLVAQASGRISSPFR
jgi:hypothetical protein